MCPECGGRVESSTYVDYCTRCDWAYGYPSLSNGVGAFGHGTSGQHEDDD